MIIQNIIGNAVILVRERNLGTASKGLPERREAFFTFWTGKKNSKSKKKYGH